MRMGFAMRQQAIAAVYTKVLRLNSSFVADVSAGKVRLALHYYNSIAGHRLRHHTVLVHPIARNEDVMTTAHMLGDL